MQDGIIKGTGNSRYLKSISNFLQQYPTYQDFVAALVAGTLPIDLNGINETGWDQLGTALNKANLLSDETADALGLPDTAVPDDALSYLGSNSAKRIKINSAVSDGSTPIIFSMLELPRNASYLFEVVPPASGIPNNPVAGANVSSSTSGIITYLRNTLNGKEAKFDTFQFFGTSVILTRFYFIYRSTGVLSGGALIGSLPRVDNFGLYLSGISISSSFALEDLLVTVSGTPSGTKVTLYREE